MTDWTEHLLATGGQWLAMKGQYPDDEIAAHLIEVYWTLNKKSAAKAIIKKIKQQGTPFPRVTETTQRLGINH